MRILLDYLYGRPDWACKDVSPETCKASVGVSWEVLRREALVDLVHVPVYHAKSCKLHQNHQITLLLSTTYWSTGPIQEDVMHLATELKLPALQEPLV